ncbi:MAG: Sec-independent protein translocase protein TatB [Chloroflexota bacterium]|nr:twin-arginine translocase subunit TatB [Chloroflexota bacterium]
MDFFGIGVPEILLIMVVALVIFGPDKLPEIAREAGKMVRQFRKMTSEATSEIRNLTNDLDLKESVKEFKSAASVVTEEVKGVKSEVTGTLREEYKAGYNALTEATLGSPAYQKEPVVTATTREVTEAERAEFNQRRLAELEKSHAGNSTLTEDRVESNHIPSSSNGHDNKIAVNQTKPRIARRTASGGLRHRERE